MNVTDDIRGAVPLAIHSGILTVRKARAPSRGDALLAFVKNKTNGAVVNLLL